MTDVKLTRSEEEQVLARENGFECLPAIERGANWYSFKKGDLHVWIVREGWQTAYLINDRFTDHQIFKTLEEALKR